MRVDNDGEGGILALMALLGVKRQRRPAIVALGLFGAALIYGDGAITPAISVLSALEGLTLAAPSLGPYVVPAAVGILIALFAIQSRGTASIGRAFGPVMAVWFATIALLGIWGITKHLAILFGLDPRYAISYLAHDGLKAFPVLGGVFLCVTGAEALYADMGHFGATPTRIAAMAAGERRRARNWRTARNEKQSAHRHSNRTVSTPRRNASASPKSGRMRAARLGKRPEFKA
jgi:KUP system potassium uptake protein